MTPPPFTVPVIPFKMEILAGKVNIMYLNNEAFNENLDTPFG